MNVEFATKKTQIQKLENTMGQLPACLAELFSEEVKTGREIQDANSPTVVLLIKVRARTVQNAGMRNVSLLVCSQTWFSLKKRGKKGSRSH